MTATDILRTIIELKGAEQYVGALQGVCSQLEATADKQRRLAADLNKLAIGFAGIAVAGAGVIAITIKQAMAYEQYQQKLEVALKSAAKAKEVFAWAQQYANVTPFATDEVIDAAARLEMYGMKAKEWLPLVGDMAGAMGRNVKQGVEAVADAVSGGGLERLKEFGIGSQQLKAAGWTGGYQTAKDLETLKRALQDIMQMRFAGGTERMSRTLGGMISTVQGNLQNLAALIGKEFLPPLVTATKGVNGIVEAFVNMSPAARRAVAAGMMLTTVGAAALAVILKLKAMEAAYLANAAAANKLASAQRLMGVAKWAGGIGLGIGVAAGIVGSIMAAKKQAEDDARDVADSLAQGIVKNTAPVNAMREKVREALDAAAAEKANAEGVGEDLATAMARGIAVAEAKLRRRQAENAAVVPETPAQQAEKEANDWALKAEQHRVNQQRLEEERKAAEKARRLDPSAWLHGRENLPSPAELEIRKRMREEAARQIEDENRSLEAQKRAEDLRAEAAKNPKADPLEQAKKMLQAAEIEAEAAKIRAQAAEGTGKSEDVAAKEAALKRAKEMADALLKQAVAEDEVAQQQRTAAAAKAPGEVRDKLNVEAQKSDLRAAQMRADAAKMVQAAEEDLAAAQKKAHDEHMRQLKEAAEAERKFRADRRDVLGNAMQYFDELGGAGGRGASDAIRQQYIEALGQDMQAKVTSPSEYWQLARERLRAQKELQSSGLSESVGQTQGAIAYWEALQKFTNEVDPARIAALHQQLAKLYSTQSEVAASQNDFAKANQLAAAAINEQKAAQDALNSSMREALGIGDAYAGYLEAIGAKEAANAYRRQTMSREYADLAQNLFAQGRMQEGWQAAAAAEKAARAGVEERGGAGSIEGFGSTRAGALTNANPFMLQNQAVAGGGWGQVNVNLNVEGKQTRRREHKAQRKADFYDAFTF